MKTITELFSEYVALANRHGWWSLRAAYWRWEHRHDVVVMALVRNAHAVRNLFRQRSFAPISQWMQSL